MRMITFGNETNATPDYWREHLTSNMHEGTFGLKIVKIAESLRTFSATHEFNLKPTGRKHHGFHLYTIGSGLVLAFHNVDGKFLILNTNAGGKHAFHCPTDHTPSQIVDIGAHDNEVFTEMQKLFENGDAPVGHVKRLLGEMNSTIMRSVEALYPSRAEFNGFRCFCVLMFLIHMGLFVGGFFFTLNNNAVFAKGISTNSDRIGGVEAKAAAQIAAQGELNEEILRGIGAQAGLNNQLAVALKAAQDAAKKSEAATQLLIEQQSASDSKLATVEVWVTDQGKNLKSLQDDVSRIFSKLEPNGTKLIGSGAQLQIGDGKENVSLSFWDGVCVLVSFMWLITEWVLIIVIGLVAVRMGLNMKVRTAKPEVRKK